MTRNGQYSSHDNYNSQLISRIDDECRNGVMIISRTVNVEVNVS